MRITGGRHRGRRLAGIPGTAVRPTSDRARQALFNILAHGPPAQAGLRIEGTVVLDAFAGTGALGIEALSRGAAHATFIDSAQTPLDAVAGNLAALGMTVEATLIRADSTAPPAAGRACDLAFLDPPYGDGPAGNDPSGGYDGGGRNGGGRNGGDMAGVALGALARAGWLADGAWCCVEHSAGSAFTPPEGFDRIETRRYGRAAIAFLRYRA